MNEFQCQLFHLMEPRLSALLAKEFGEVLEHKHLYQNHAVAFPEFDVMFKGLEPELASHFSGARPPISPSPLPSPGSPQTDLKGECQEIYESGTEFEWRIENPSQRRGGFLPSQSDDLEVPISFTPPTIKVFCHVCQDVEPYNFEYGTDILEEFRGIENRETQTTEQVFAIAYQCQGCKSLPEVFMVRRQGMKLILSGRTPIEQVPIPNYLPKEERKYFSDAVVAYNSGQVLAGNFLLRVFIEQYVRSVCDNPHCQDIDALFNEYNTKLPEDFKQRFPSLRHVYDRLSDDIHRATASEECFVESKKDLEAHFDARRVYEI
jgi:hypothetical protein